MKDRLLKFMQIENISAGKLAEIIGVQPSAISHILSGRNKPGFDFLAGLFAQFPDLNPRWMIVGEGSIMTPADSIEEKGLSADNNDLFSETLSPPVDARTAEVTKNTINCSRHIERIVVFHTDGTFSSYEQQ